MKTYHSALVLGAAAAALAFTAAPALAGPGKKAPAVTGVSPKQPIPYAQLDAYTKATPKQRASRDWSVADTGVTADTSAIAPVATPPADTSTAVNPPSVVGDTIPPVNPDMATPPPGMTGSDTTATPGTPGEEPK